MKLTTTTKVFICQDANGILQEHIRREVNLGKKDTVNKRYEIETSDFIVWNYKNKELTESCSPLLDRNGFHQTKTFYKTYDEYDNERAQLQEMFPSNLMGSELDDYLLVCSTKLSLQTIPIYHGFGDIEWE